MTRREMLQYSLRNLSQALPAVLGIAGELGGFWKETKEEVPLQGAACFPEGPKDSGAGWTRKETTSSEERSNRRNKE